VILPVVLAAVLAIVVSRLVVQRAIVPAWRDERLTDGAAALTVVISRGLTLVVLIMAVIVGAELPIVPGLLTAFATALVYGVVGWRSIRAMFRTSELNPRSRR
jgi:hypothetical protein